MKTGAAPTTVTPSASRRRETPSRVFNNLLSTVFGFEKGKS